MEKRETPNADYLAEIAQELINDPDWDLDPQLRFWLMRPVSSDLLFL